MSGLNKALLAVMVAIGGYNAWGTYRQKLLPMAPLYPKPYVIVYGRESCGNCQAMRRGLEERGVPYVWKIIDEDPGRTEAFSRMKEAGLDIRRFTLPVVDVNAEILVQPGSPAVIAKYRL
ncbi:MAG: glutaredoxin family protein [Elusimicrobiota bacterium]|nr:glutaredoxin family protein [Elusimicrobiota bacterium]